MTQAVTPNRGGVPENTWATRALFFPLADQTEPAWREQARRHRLWNTLGGGVLLVLVLFTNVSTAVAQNRDPATCVVAMELVERGLPMRALALIEAAFQPGGAGGDGPCQDTRRLASEKISSSFQGAIRAKDLLNEKKWSESLAAADAAVAVNADNDAARIISQSAKDQIAAAPKTAFEELQSGWKQFNEHYLAPLGDLLVPFVTWLLSLLVAARLLVLLVVKWPALERAPSNMRSRYVLVVGIVGLVLGSAALSFGMARTFDGSLWLLGLTFIHLAVFGIFAWQVVEEGRSAESATKDLALIEVLLALTVIFTASGSVLYVVRTDEARMLSLAFAALSSIVGVALAAWWLATRLRLEVKVTYEDDQEKRADAAQVSALLNELGAEKPRGLEVPRGTDTTALTGALTALPENAISKVVRQVISTITGSTPWVATIEGGMDRRTVSISRNGRTVESAVIDRHNYDAAMAASSANRTADTMVDAPLRMASAFILFTLSREHQSIRKGLAGANDWRSVGLQYVATTLLATDANADARKEMLARALELDPNNLAAQLAFRHALERKSTNARVLINYRKWLKDREGELEATGLSHSAVLLRACYTRTVVATNAVFADDYTSTELEKASERVCRARDALGDLDKLLARLRQTEDLLPIISAIKDNSAGLRRLLAKDEAADVACDADSTPQIVAQAPGRNFATKSPTGMYNDACYLASWRSWALLSEDDHAQEPTPGETLQDDKKAIDLLQRAAAAPAIASWLLDDPQLKAFRSRGPFRRSFLKVPRSNLYELDPIKPFAAELLAAGYGSFYALARIRNNDDSLAQVIPADITVRRAITELAYLCSKVSFELRQQNWNLEMLDQLGLRGIATEGALRTLLPGERDVVSRDLAKAIVDTFKTSDPDDQPYTDVVSGVKTRIELWLASF